MNHSRGWLIQSKPRRLATASFVAGLSLIPLIPVACFLAGGSRALALAPDERAPQAAEADVLPGSNPTPAPDMVLRPDGAAKAAALTAFARAIIAEDGADSDAALAEYQKALALDPGYTELAVKVAYELARRGDASSGIQVLKDSIQANPKAPLAYLYLSQLYAKFLGKPEIGLKYAQQALDLDPGNFASYLAVYEIFQATGQPAKASALIDRAQKQHSSDPQFWVQLGDLYIKNLGDVPPKPADIARLNIIYGYALALDGNTPATLQRVADFYANSSQQKAAIPLYLRAIKLSPANANEGDETLSAIRNSLALCFDAVGKTPEAISTLEKLIKDDPLRAESYEALCDLYEKTGDTEGALGVCKQLILLNPSDFRNYIRSAALQMKEKKSDAAIQILNDARIKFPTEAQVTYSLGLALCEAKKYQEALDIFEQADTEAAGGETEMLDAQFYFSYGAAAEQAGKVDKAAELFRKSIQLDPQNAAEALNYMGFMWVDRNMKLAEAAGYIKRALQIDPANPAYIDSLGWYYYRMGQYSQAIDLLKKAATSIQPEDSECDGHLGDAYAAQGNTADALKYWKKAAALDKDNKDLAVKIAGAVQKLAKQGTPAPSTP